VELESVARSSRGGVTRGAHRRLTIDLASLDEIRTAIGATATLMIDANQAWSMDEAREALRAYAEFDLAFAEEPLRADRPLVEWLALAADSPMPLAAGENIADTESFEQIIASRAVAYLQPDLAKWGGVSGCLAVALKAKAAGLVYCPHYLGGGVGLLSSAHVLAAQGGDGLLEIDVNPNRLREDLAGALTIVEDGHVTLSDAPGIGIDPIDLFA